MTKLYPQGDLVLQQDGATLHTSRATKQFLKDQEVGFMAKDDWPPESPDLSPMDSAVETGIKISGNLIYNFRYADDTTLLAKTKEGLQKNLCKC
ncbi:transposable element Tc3 transposase [Elysia marginata]|uniref:Transposable element Tc3 transposase n=1 Tax=Elysia marginata TaxID=1093978 RepID=A0AAV4HIW9_9GAST|nr:transposable element Tc3 transposase [Elysia marginata]